MFSWLRDLWNRWFNPLPEVPIPPRLPNLPWEVGVTFAPFTEEEWAHVSWNPVWRVELDQVEEAIRRSTKVLVITKTDDEVTRILPFLWKLWGVELGNEPDGKNPSQLNQFYLRSVKTLRNNGFIGKIMTAGVANLNDDTLRWAKKSIQNLPPDIIFGWHAYGMWNSQLGKLHGMLEGRRHAMTESGYSNSAASEKDIAGLVAQDLQHVYDVGAMTYILYQMHDGPPGSYQGDFGLHAWDGHWRPVEQSLIRGV